MPLLAYVRFVNILPENCLEIGNFAVASRRGVTITQGKVSKAGFHLRERELREREVVLFCGVVFIV